MEQTIFTPIQLSYDLVQKKDQTYQEYLTTLLNTSSVLRAQPSEWQTKDHDYVEIIELHHKHTVPVAVKVICDFNSMNTLIERNNIELSIDEKNLLLIKLRLLQYLHNLSQHVLCVSEIFINDFEKIKSFTERYTELLSPLPMKVFFSLTKIEQFRDEIFEKITLTFTSLLRLHCSENFFFQRRIKYEENTLKDSLSFAIQFWNCIFEFYDSFNLKSFDDICQNAININPSFLNIYRDFSSKHIKINFVKFVEDYITLNILDSQQNIDQNNINDDDNPNDLFRYFLVQFFPQEVEALKKFDKTKMLQNVDSIKQLQLVVLFVELLAELVAFENFRKDMQFNRDLLSVLIELGLYLKELEQHDPENFKPISTLKQANSISNSVTNPSGGLKKNIVKLIGNLVHEHLANQDLAREKGGISFLLDCTQIDERNAFIQQWAIVALRNVLENNFKNQQFVASIQQKSNKRQAD